MPILRLSDDELEEVARALAGCSEIGPGTVHRVCVELQRQFSDPPDLSRFAGR